MILFLDNYTLAS